MISRFSLITRFCLTSLLVCLLVISWQIPAKGQFSLATDNNSSNLPPLEVIRYGNIEVTWVKSPLDIKTVPLQQWLVGREYRLRVRRAFAQHNIVIGRPQWISYNTTLNGDKPQN